MQVLSLGGSLIAPREGGYNRNFIHSFIALIREMVADNRRYVIICGGGSLARSVQSVYRDAPQPTHEWLDKIGIAATQVHAHLVAALCSQFAPTWINPASIGAEITSADIDADAHILVSGGGMLGVSTDYIAVRFAALLKARQIINISDIPYIYNQDPRLNPSAHPLPTLTWHELARIVGSQWSPGAHLPFDPKAIQLAAQHNMQLVCTGSSIDSIRKALGNQKTEGSVVG